MAINKPVTQTTTENDVQKHKHGDVIFRSMKSEKNKNFLGYATVFYHDFVLSNIAVTIVQKNGESFAALTFPGTPRMKKEDGKNVPALDENGRQIYNNYFNPVSKAARDEMTKWVEDEVNRVLEEEAKNAGE